jgi:hypothetical protein
MDPFTALGLGISLAVVIRSTITGFPSQSYTYVPPPEAPTTPSSWQPLDQTDDDHMLLSADFDNSSPGNLYHDTADTIGCTTRVLSKKERQEAAEAIRQARRKP